MTLFELHWSQPYFLLLLPLAVLPWLTRNLEKNIAWSEFVPVDPVSKFIGLFLKLLASFAIAGLILALTGPYIPEKTVERIGEGAEIVLLLDRSRSMDTPFASKGARAALVNRNRPSKRQVAKDYLSAFVQKRPDDRFGFVLFSSKAIKLLPLTYNKESVLATVNASALGRGLTNTNVSAALINAAEMFEGQVYRGSRIVLLVSDGGQILSDDEKKKITALYKQMNLTIYWIYITAINGMSINADAVDNYLWEDLPERKLHDFFESMGTPYTAFEASTLDDFSKAMDEIDRQQYQTLIVEETLPKEQKHKLFYWFVLIALLILASSRVYTAWGVKKAYE